MHVFRVQRELEISQVPRRGELVSESRADWDESQFAMLLSTFKISCKSPEYTLYLLMDTEWTDKFLNVLFLRLE